MSSVLSPLAAALLLVLPGAWLVFHSRLPGLTVAERLALAGALSPVVVAAQFYLLRYAGLPFERAASGVFLVNLPAAFLIWRRAQTIKPSVHQLGPIAVTALLAGCVAVPWFTTAQLRMLESHTWMQTPIVYQIALGRLAPEEPDLAGVPLAYPWLAHVFWAVGSWLSGWAPTRFFAFADLAALVWVLMGVYCTCRRLGSRRFSATTALLWLALGTNVVGFLILRLSGWLPGDIRYTPWLRKFTTFETTPLALPLFAAAVLTAVIAATEQRRHAMRLTAVVIAALGALYPLMTPAAAAVGAGLVWALWLGRGADEDASMPRYGEFVLWLGGALTVSVGFAMLFTRSVGHSPVALSDISAMVSKSGSSAIALAPFALGTAACWKRCGWPAARQLLLISVAGSLASMIAWRLTDGYLEYKFMFLAAIAAAPLAAQAFEGWVRPQSAGALLVVASAILLLPAVSAKGVDERWDVMNKTPAMADSSFWPAFVLPQPDFDWVPAVREGTPPDTMMIVDSPQLFVPGLVGRSLFAPVARRVYPGYWFVHPTYLVGERGYDRTFVRERMSLVRQLYDSHDESSMQAAIDRLRALGRPVAILFEHDKGADFSAWLQRTEQGRLLHRGQRGTIVWLLP